MGSRYGGLKQLDPVGPSDEVVLDYSVHDALRAGFSRVVFVIRRDFEKEFRDKILPRYEGKVETALAFQDLDDLPRGLVKSSERTKPWGTGHAIWAARNVVNTAFLAVNADDFYGLEAFSMMAGFLRKLSEAPRIAMVAHLLRNTLSEHGAVSRGVCTVGPEDWLESVQEHTGIARENGEIRGVDLAGDAVTLSGDELVSMNFWGFPVEIFRWLESGFGNFLARGGLGNPKSEYYIPSAVSEIIASGLAPASVLRSNGRWYGVTYREDREYVSAALMAMSRQGLYPTPLWNTKS